MQPTVKILVCAHKQDFVLRNEVYLPIQVGKAISTITLDMQGDNTGDHISDKNKSFCELTALYWAWKNLPAVDFVGLCHYRRYFCFRPDRFEPRDLLVAAPKELNRADIPAEEIARRMEQCDMILAEPIRYEYSLQTDYCLCHMSDDLRVLRQIIQERHPDYLPDFDHIMRRNNKLSHYNMFVTRYELFDDYCTWLFDILFEAERRIRIEHYSDVQKRIFGYMSERLLNVYCRHRRLKVNYLPVLYVGEAKTTTKLRAWWRHLRRTLKFRIQKL